MGVVQRTTLFWVAFLQYSIVLGILSSTSWAAMDAYGTHVRSQCGFTRYPQLCVDTLMPLELHMDHPMGNHIVHALVNTTISETRRHLPPPYLAQLLVGSSRLADHDARHAKAVTDCCGEMLTLSLKRLLQALEALRISPTKNKGDIQTWLSASITLQQACKDTADAISSSSFSQKNMMTEISKKTEYLSQLASNSLALANRITNNGSNGSVDHGDDSPDFPSWVSRKQRKLLQGSSSGSGAIQANAVVAQDGTGDYRTVSEAIRAASSHNGRFVIHVKAGVYREKIHCNRDGLTLIGDGKYSTIIVGADSVAGGSSLFGSATFTITGDGFIAHDIGFQNTAGPQGHQAVALTVASDRSVFYRCSMAGYQDTLFALTLRQFYRECDIFGTIDFIFGNAAAVFQSCYLVMRRPLKQGYNVILANGRSDPGQNTGFTVQNSRIIKGTEFSPVKRISKSYLGRPWKQFSRSIVMESDIDEAIASRGWIEWPGYGSSTYKSLYFAEYGNRGTGAATAGRVSWPGFHVIGPEEAAKFTVGNFIAGTSWIPSTGVTFVSGLQ